MNDNLAAASLVNPASSPLAVDFRDVTKRYDDTGRAFRRRQFGHPHRADLGPAWPNGAGKSTAISLMLGLLEAQLPDPSGPSGSTRGSRSPTAGSGRSSRPRACRSPPESMSWSPSCGASIRSRCRWWRSLSGRACASWKGVRSRRCRAAKGSVSGSRWRSPVTRTWYSSTSRRSGWMSRPGGPSGSRSGGSPPRAGRWCSRPTISRRPTSGRADRGA